MIKSASQSSGTNPPLQQGLFLACALSSEVDIRYSRTPSVRGRLARGREQLAVRRETAVLHEFPAAGWICCAHNAALRVLALATWSACSAGPAGVRKDLLRSGRSSSATTESQVGRMGGQRLDVTAWDRTPGACRARQPPGRRCAACNAPTPLSHDLRERVCERGRSRCGAAGYRRCGRHDRVCGQPARWSDWRGPAARPSRCAARAPERRTSTVEVRRSGPRAAHLDCRGRAAASWRQVPRRIRASRILVRARRTCACTHEHCQGAP